MFNQSYQTNIKGGKVKFGTGWLPPQPDLRDYTFKNPEIQFLAKELGLQAFEDPGALPPLVDLRKWCSPMENQLNLGSCTANAAVGAVEYFENRAFGNHLDGSRLFVYKATRNLMGVTGDTGAWLRNTMGALALLGVPPEKYWPYETAQFDDEPTSFVYSVADSFEALKYFCHDPLGENISKENVRDSVKRYLAAGIPSMFGFYGFPSFSQSDENGQIPFPCNDEKAQWGHAVLAVGYNDGLIITNKRCNKATTGAFLIRNSWGEEWGENGYGWLPYEYILYGLACDFWSLLRMKWVETKHFGLDL